MNILFNTYPMAFHTPGGGEQQLLKYKEYLITQGIKVQLFDLWDPQFLSSDLLHFFSCMPGSLYFTRYAKSLGLPVIVSPNLWITEETKDNYPYLEIKTQLIESDFIICNSNAECDLLSSVLEIPRNKFKTVYNGVDKSFFNKKIEKSFRQHFSINSPFILNVANIEKRKNQLNLIKAMKSFPEMKLVIIGHKRDPIYAQECLNEGGDQVIYIGPLDHNDELLRSAYTQCEIFALPSLLETPGLAALEAAACGARIIITKEGCTKEYFKEIAFYVEGTEKQSVIPEIVKAIHNALKTKKGLLTQEIKKNFSWSSVLKQLINIYENYELFGPKNIKATGFNLIEYNENQDAFAWSKYYATLECHISGILSFQWRSETEALVNIKVNGKLIEQDILVSSSWVPFVINLQTKVKQLHHIEFIIKSLNNINTNDVKERGIALRKIDTFEISKSTKQTNLNLWYEGKGLLFEPHSIIATGFNLMEYNEEQGAFAWSKKNASLDCKIEGRLSFECRAVSEALVDIKINGNIIEQSMLVSSSWSSFTIDLLNENKQQNLIELIVKPLNNDFLQGHRELGIGISKIEIIREKV